jgi:predicted alpha/beta-fold hydrolase
VIGNPIAHSRSPEIHAMFAAQTGESIDYGRLLAPLHGFAGAIDYWTRSSCRQYLGGIAVPTLVINALNDPFLPPSALASPAEVSAAVRLEYPAQGGHVGFLTGRPPGRLDWLPQRAFDHFADVLGAAAVGVPERRGAARADR